LILSSTQEGYSPAHTRKPRRLQTLLHICSIYCKACSIHPAQPSLLCTWCMACCPVPDPAASSNSRSDWSACWHSLRCCTAIAARSGSHRIDFPPTQLVPKALTLCVRVRVCVVCMRLCVCLVCAADGLVSAGHCEVKCKVSLHTCWGLTALMPPTHWDVINMLAAGGSAGHIESGGQ
jgi:hypothetical protein